MDEEFWLPVIGHENYYEVSNYGRVKRVAPGNHTRPGFILKPNKVRSGYLIYALYKNGVKTYHLAHTLVLAAFVHPRPEGMEGCHNDGDRENNRLDNLRWDTHSNNQLDMVKHGTHPESRKTHCPRGHEYTPENTYYEKGTHRVCRTCKLAAQLARRVRQKALRMSGASATINTPNKEDK